jgi:hypothetical protein
MYRRCCALNIDMDETGTSHLQTLFANDWGSWSRDVRLAAGTRKREVLRTTSYINNIYYFCSRDKYKRESEDLGFPRDTFSAARVKFPSSAIINKYRSWRTSISSPYRFKKFYLSIELIIACLLMWGITLYYRS